MVISGSAYLAAKYTDGTKKLLMYGSSIPMGEVLRGQELASFTITASPGVHEQQPAVVPLRFENTTPNVPAGFETAVVEAEFTSYNYDESEGLANWSAILKVENVLVSGSIVNGDPEIVCEL